MPRLSEGAGAEGLSVACVPSGHRARLGAAAQAELVFQAPAPWVLAVGLFLGLREPDGLGQPKHTLGTQAQALRHLRLGTQPGLPWGW